MNTIFSLSTVIFEILYKIKNMNLCEIYKLCDFSKKFPEPLDVSRKIVYNEYSDK